MTDSAKIEGLPADERLSTNVLDNKDERIARLTNLLQMANERIKALEGGHYQQPEPPRSTSVGRSWCERHGATVRFIRVDGLAKVIYHVELRGRHPRRGLGPVGVGASLDEAVESLKRAGRKVYEEIQVAASRRSPVKVQAPCGGEKCSEALGASLSWSEGGAEVEFEPYGEQEGPCCDRSEMDVSCEFAETK